MIRVAAALMLMALGTPAAAEETTEVYHVGEDSSQFGRPKRIVVPEYPADALERHITGYVDMRGHVSPLMAFERVEYTPGAPEAAIFVESLKSVVRHWEFHPVYRNACFPADDPVTVRVNFEIEEGKPKIFVTVARADTPKEQAMSIVDRPAPRYPRTAQRAGLQAYVYGRLAVAPDGSVTGVETEVYPRRNTLDNLIFEREVKEAFSKWRFNPLPEGQMRERVACEEVFFLLKD